MSEENNHTLQYDVSWCPQCDTEKPATYRDVHDDRPVIRCSVCHHTLHQLQPGEPFFHVSG